MDLVNQTPLRALAELSDALARSTALDALSEALRTRLAALVPHAELVCDLTSFDLNRPALVRQGVDDEWTRRYNDGLYSLNPATSQLRSLLAAGAPVARRFEDLCRGPLSETRFYTEYMLPQGHTHSLLAAMPLTGIAVANVAPALILLLVRKTPVPFTDAELDTVLIALPALALALGRIVRSSDEWAGAVVKHAFSLPPKLAEVALLIAQGLPNQEIADRLGITLGTAKHYVHKLLDATGASSRADLCRILLS